MIKVKVYGAVQIAKIAVQHRRSFGTFSSLFVLAKAIR
jgi:hypothetical protein